MTHHVERRAWPEDDDPKGDGGETMRVLGVWGLGESKGNAPRKSETTAEQGDSKENREAGPPTDPFFIHLFVSFIHPRTKRSQCKMRFFNWGLWSQFSSIFASIRNNQCKKRPIKTRHSIST